MSDFNFDDDGDLAPRRSTTKVNRRRRNDSNDENDDDFGATLDTSRIQQETVSKSNKREYNRPEVKPSQAISGWGDEAIDGNAQMMTKNTNGRRRSSTDLDNEKKLKLKATNNEESGDEIPQIPDLEEANDFDDMAFQVADAPEIQVHQISTYKELDKEFFREKAFQFLEGNIDVSLLHCGLYPEDQIVEDDKIWEWNKLFTEVVSILTAEEEQKSLQQSNQTQ